MNFRFGTLCSGSSGNSSYIETKNAKLLIDAGLCGRDLEQLLRSVRVNPEDLDGILITHEHSDHMVGAGVLSRRYNVPILATEGTWQGMHKKIGKIADENILVFKNGLDFNFIDFNIHPMSVYHDANDPTGFIFYGNGKKEKKISYLTDTGLVDNRMKRLMAGSDIYYIESNFDPDMLTYGPYTEWMKKRIRSQHGHLSNTETAEVLTELVMGKEEKIFLGHLSVNNNMGQLALEETEGTLLSLGVDINRDVSVEVSQRYVSSGLVEI